MDQIGQFILNHWELWLALIVILLFIFINELLSQKKRAKELSPAAVVELINHSDAVVIDLRDQETFRGGHIIDAICASADDFHQNKMDKYKTKPLVLVCARGLQSSALATKLRTQGFTQPMVLSGGLTAWQTASLPLIKGKNSK
jgi:rhodanese-related sulfurtransferase